VTIKRLVQPNSNSLIRAGFGATNFLIKQKKVQIIGGVALTG
jgi:hypothetical protein